MEAIVSYFVVGVVTLGLGFLYARLTGQTVASQWHRAFALAQELVPAVEQFWLTGKISKAQRLDEVLRELRIHFPDLQEKHLRWAVENAVNLMNQGKLIPLITESTENVAGWLQRNP